MRLRRGAYLYYRVYLRRGQTPSEQHGHPPNQWDEAFCRVAERLALWEADGRKVEEFEG